MTEQRAEIAMNRLLASIDKAAAVTPAFVDGLVFIVIVAEPATGILSWGSNCEPDMALTLMGEIVLADAEVPEGMVQ